MLKVLPVWCLCATSEAVLSLRLLQALYTECRRMLLDARTMAQPLHVQQQHVYQDHGSPQAVVFLALDIEWWEKSNEYILEVGYSLWDTVTQRHRTKHWIIRENFNKVHKGRVSCKQQQWHLHTIAAIDFVHRDCRSCLQIATTMFACIVWSLIGGISHLHSYTYTCVAGAKCRKRARLYEPLCRIV